MNLTHWTMREKKYQGYATWGDGQCDIGQTIAQAIVLCTIHAITMITCIIIV